MKRMGVYATREEANELSEFLEMARRTPVIALSMAHGIERGGLAGEAWDRLHRRCHRYALAHGLPEIPGYYGIDLVNREFVNAFADDLPDTP